MTALQEQARALGDPTRHAIFRYVVDAGRPVDIAELTDHFGLNHNAIRQHLAKLVSAGLVVEGRAPSTGRGRPRLVYEPHPAADSRWGVMGPYEQLSVLLTEIIRSGDSAVDVGRRSIAPARGSARAAEDPVAFVVEAMERRGFEPAVRSARGDRVDLVLRHCPFESAVLTDPDTICDLHLGMAEGVAELTGHRLVVDELVARDPRRAGCRFRMHLEPADDA
jgi:predicted ArsR family transcriptional regulator